MKSAPENESPLQGAESVVFVCTQDTSYCPECGMRHGECLNCGGWLHSERDGGYENQYCTQECADEAAKFQAREKARFASDWCPSCGFDNWEHADDCGRQFDGDEGA